MNRYEFALLRYLHDPSAGEFANIGVVLYEPESQRLRFKTSDRSRRISEFFRAINPAAYKTLVRHVERSFAAVEESMSEPELLGTPTSLREALDRVLFDPDSCIRASEIMSGVHENVAQRFEQIFEEFVARYDANVERPRREEADIRRDVSQHIVRAGLAQRVEFDYALTTPTYRHVFDAKWMNGKPQVLEAITMDLINADYIVEKATHWCGRLTTLSRANDFEFTAVIAPPADANLERGFEKAVAILRSVPAVREVVLDRQIERAIALIQADVADAGG